MIEYDPTRPEVNRLQGTLVDVPTSPVVPLLILLAIPLIVVGCSPWLGVRRIKLLRWGRSGWAVLTSVKIPRNKETIELPLDQYKQQVRDQQQKSNLAAHQTGPVVLFWAIGFLIGLFVGLWGGFLGIALAIFWEKLLGNAVVAPRPLALGSLGFLVAFTFVILGPMTKRRRRWLDEAKGIGPSPPLPRQDFRYTFATETGKSSRGRGSSA